MYTLYSVYTILHYTYKHAHINSHQPHQSCFHVYLNTNGSCTLYTVHCTLYSVHCIVYTVHCTLYSVQCTVYIVQCLEYIRRAYTIRRLYSLYRFLCDANHKFNWRCTFITVPEVEPLFRGQFRFYGKWSVGQLAWSLWARVDGWAIYPGYHGYPGSRDTEQEVLATAETVIIEIRIVITT